MFVQAEYASHSMLKSRKLLILICVLAIGTESVIALPDKYEIQEPDSNKKINLIDLLPDESDNEKDYRRKSEEEEEALENWTGKWMPSHLGEPTPPPKIFSKTNSGSKEVHHDDRIPMGVKSKFCDDGKTNLTVDWNYSETSYTCFGEKIEPDTSVMPEQYCEQIPKHYVAMHQCMTESINYENDIPLFGTHRPIWPVYGEYKYLPKQRWLHSLEHGGLVMLYHPCANNLEVDRLKKLVKGCIRRHIISPYDLLDENRPLALLTWGCRLTLTHVNQNIVTEFIHNHALHAPERNIYKDGDFDDQLIEKAQIVSDEQDSILCSKLM